MAVQFLLLPFYLLLLYSLLTIRLKKRYPSPELQKLYKRGILIKFFGGFMFFAIYKYYYIYGDTFGYYMHGNTLATLFFKDQAGFWKFLFSKAADYEAFIKPSHQILIDHRWGKFFKDSDSWLMVRISAICNLLTFNSYLFTTFFFSSFSFYGLWKMFLVFYKRYPNLKTPFFLAVFAVPSVLFWGSGLLKDTLTIGGLGILIFQFDKLFYRGKFSFVSFIVIFIVARMVLILKGYILLAFMPPLFLSLYFFYLSQINGIFLKSITAIVLLAGIAFGGAFLLQYFATVSQDFALDRLAEVAESFSDHHTRLYESGRAGSGYSLHISSYTMGGMLQVFPQAVNVTLFRPYFWEVSSPIMLLSAIESMVLFFFTVYVFLKGRVFGFIRKLTNPFALICILYSVILGFAIGITAFNFGALVRFKIPLIPLYIIGIYIIKEELSKKKANSDNAVSEELNIDGEKENQPEVKA